MTKEYQRVLEGRVLFYKHRLDQPFHSQLCFTLATGEDESCLLLPTERAPIPKWVSRANSLYSAVSQCGVIYLQAHLGPYNFSGLPTFFDSN